MVKSGVMTCQTFAKPAGALTALLLLGSSAAQAGLHHLSAAKSAVDPKAPIPPKYAPAPPPKDCDGCVDPGVFLMGSFLYLHSFNSEENDYRGEWDPGVRGTVGWVNPSGLTFALTGFYHETDYESDLGANNGELEFFYLDFTIGDTIKCGELCLSYAGGVRYAHNEFNEDRGGVLDGSEIDAFGPVIKIGATRTVHERLDLYADLRQSLLFGEDEYTDIAGNTFPTDTLLAITEIEIGAQYNFALGGIDAFLRAGLEGQYWWEDGANIGLFGGVFSLGGHF